MYAWDSLGVVTICPAFCTVALLHLQQRGVDSENLEFYLDLEMVSMCKDAFGLSSNAVPCSHDGSCVARLFIKPSISTGRSAVSLAPDFPSQSQRPALCPAAPRRPPPARTQAGIAVRWTLSSPAAVPDLARYHLSRRARYIPDHTACSRVCAGGE